MGSSAGSIKLNVPWALNGWGKLDAVNREYVENLFISTGVYIGDVPPTTPAPTPGLMWWRTIDNDLYIYYVNEWVAAVATPGTSPIPFNTSAEQFRAIDFPPNPAIGDIFDVPGAGIYQWDGIVWTRLPPYVLKSGDTMTGPLILPRQPPIDELHAATKEYVDRAVAAGHLFRGTWEVANNNPDLNIPPMNPLNGWNWICVTQDINTPDQAPAGLPGIGGMDINNGDYVYWSDVNGQYQRVIGGSLTKQQADAFYVDVTGDTMSGTLTINTPITGSINSLLTTGPIVINNQTTMSALTINNPTPGLGALDIFDNSNAHTVMITNNAGGLALQIIDNAATGGDAVWFNNNGSGDTLRVTKTENFGGSAALVVDAGNRAATGSGGNSQIAFTCPGGGRPQWITTWTDVGGGAGANAEAIGFYNNDHNGGGYPTNARFAGSFNNGRFTLGYGSTTAPTLTWGNGPHAGGGGGFTIDTTTGFYRPGTNQIGLTINGGTTTYVWSQNDFVINNAHTQINRTAGQISLSLVEGYLRLYKNNTTNGVPWPDINFAVPSGRDAASNAKIRCQQTGPYSYYGTVNNFEFYCGRGGYGQQRAFWTVDQGGGWCGLQAQGNMYAATFSQVSDLSLKMDVSPVNMLDVEKAFRQLKPVRFKWKPLEIENELAAPEKKSQMAHGDPKRLHWGFVADDIEKGSSDIVQTQNDIKSYDLAAVVAILTAKIKQLEERLNGMGQR